VDKEAKKKLMIMPIFYAPRYKCWSEPLSSATEIEMRNFYANAFDLTNDMKRYRKRTIEYKK